MLYPSIPPHTAWRNRYPAGMHPRLLDPHRARPIVNPCGPVTLRVEKTRPVEKIVVGHRCPAPAPPRPGQEERIAVVGYLTFASLAWTHYHCGENHRSTSFKFSHIDPHGYSIRVPRDRRAPKWLRTAEPAVIQLSVLYVARNTYRTRSRTQVVVPGASIPLCTHTHTHPMQDPDQQRERGDRTNTLAMAPVRNRISKSSTTRIRKPNIIIHTLKSTKAKIINIVTT